jgi:hypothetical protein
MEDIKNPLDRFETVAPPLRKDQETRKEKKARLWREGILEARENAINGLQQYNPKADPNAKGDPYKTIFVCRIVIMS